jgi:hypothetical protein
MSLLLVYRAFKADLKGWAKITFDEFRTIYDPLRRRRAWTTDDQKRLDESADQGGAYALRRLYTKTAVTKTQIEKLLGDRGADPEFMARDELDSHMKYLIAACLRDGWSPQTFTSFGAYLDSDKGPADLVETRVAGSASTMFKSSLDTVQALVAETKEPDAATTDLFAEKYRAACPAFKEVVQAHLKEGAHSAAQKAKAELVSTID